MIDERVVFMAITQGKLTQITLSDLPLLSGWTLKIARRRHNIYAACSRGLGRRGSVEFIYLHRLLTLAPEGVQIDHINGDGLDNRRVNLRHATQSQNNANQRKKVPGTSKYKGVSLHVDHRYDSRRWKTQLTVKGHHYCTYHDTEEEAALAYNEIAEKAFGEYARLNDVVMPAEAAR